MIELALKGAGYVSPNPLVGCIIAHNNIIIGVGHHKQFEKNILKYAINMLKIISSAKSNLC